MSEFKIGDRVTTPYVSGACQVMDIRPGVLSLRCPDGGEYEVLTRSCHPLVTSDSQSKPAAPFKVGDFVTTRWVIGVCKVVDVNGDNLQLVNPDGYPAQAPANRCKMMLAKSEPEARPPAAQSVYMDPDELHAMFPTSAAANAPVCMKPGYNGIATFTPEPIGRPAYDDFEVGENLADECGRLSAEVDACHEACAVLNTRISDLESDLRVKTKRVSYLEDQVRMLKRGCR